MWEEFFYNLISTVLGVMIGGFITIKVSNITNITLLRKQHTLDIYQKIKEMLRAWSEHILLDSTSFFECKDISNFKAISLCEELHLLVVYFDTNISVLKIFKERFDKLKKYEIKMQIKAETLKKRLISFSEKYESTNPEHLYEYKEVSQVLEEYANELFELHKDVEKLIAEIDHHVDKDILRYPLFKASHLGNF